MKILFCGGGTLGSVVPLMAVAEELKDRRPDFEYIFVGTLNGPEKEIVKDYNMDFYGVHSGKLRRYFSWQNFFDIFYIMVAFFEAIYLIIKLRPKVIVSAGSYVAVPVVWAGAMLGVPGLIHQQDVRVGLANRLCALVAHKTTLCFKESLVKFKTNKSLVVGNPVRQAIKYPDQDSLERVKKELALGDHLPIVLVMGGGTGALKLNQIVIQALPYLADICQVVHITGKHKFLDTSSVSGYVNYKHFDFVKDTTSLLHLVDVVVTRAGMGALTEVAYLSKPSIIIPIPDSHQEDNAAYFFKHRAGMILDQSELHGEIFAEKLKQLIADTKKRHQFTKEIHLIMKWGAESKIAEMVLEMAE